MHAGGGVVKALAMAAMLVVADAGVALACGGGGGGGGGGHGGGGSRSSCADTSETVGISHCRHFGAWAQEAALPRFIYGFEMIDHQFLTPPIDVTGTVAHEGTTYTFRVSSTSASASAAAVHANAIAVRIRLGTMTRGPFYGAIETDIGGLTSGPTLGPEGMADGYQPTYDGPDTMYSAFHGVAGARAKLGMLSLSAELAGGLRMLTFMVSDQLGSCASSGSAVTATAEIEARARADVWVSPHLTVGASIGSSLLDRDDRTIAVGITGHLRAFDGSR